MPNYDDIINLKRHVSKTRKPMSIYNRSAQFAPFSALKGYQEKIYEINRQNSGSSSTVYVVINNKNDKLNKRVNK